MSRMHGAVEGEPEFCPVGSHQEPNTHCLHWYEGASCCRCNAGPPVVKREPMFIPTFFGHAAPATVPCQFVLRQYPDAICAVNQTREKTNIYCIQSASFPSEPGRGISVWCFTEDDAWIDAMQRLSWEGRGVRTGHA